MLLNLFKIIEAPGEIPFSVELDTSDWQLPSIKAFSTPIKVKGRVVNSADVLTLEADLETGLHCICDRCSSEFEDTKTMNISVGLSAEPQDEDNPDIFMLDGDFIDLNEVIRTLFIFEMDTKLLCRESCMGICAKCGKNLNDGPCNCKKDIDPRLAVLEQLLND